MTNMTPNQVLGHIVTTIASHTNWQEAIAPWLESPLTDGQKVRPEYAALRAFKDSDVNLSEPLIYEGRAKIVLSSRDASLPFMAVLSADPGDQWRLRAFESQCPACFGEGVLGYHPKWEICFSCGATGWGLADF
jgi:hypothetical protein